MAKEQINEATVKTEGGKEVKEKGKFIKKIKSGAKKVWAKAKMPVAFVAGGLSTFIMNILFGGHFDPGVQALPDKSATEAPVEAAAETTTETK